MATQAGHGQEVHQRLPRRRHARFVEAPPQLRSGERSVGLQCPDDYRHPALLVSLVDLELTESPFHARQHPVSGQSVEEPVVIRTHQVQRAPVEGGHHETSVVERGIDISGHQPTCPAANGQPEPPRILGLHGQQVAHRGLDGVSRRARQEL